MLRNTRPNVNACPRFKNSDRISERGDTHGVTPPRAICNSLTPCSMVGLGKRLCKLPAEALRNVCPPNPRQIP
jgi:hypothetical protein